MSNQPPYVPDPRYSQSNEPTEPVTYDQSMYAQDNGYVQQGRRESYVDAAGRRVERRRETFDDPVQRQTNLRYWIAGVVYFLLGVLEVILAMRFVFRLLGANDTNGFVSTLYSFSYTFSAPFAGIFGSDPGLGQGHVFEVSTLIAMIIYALIAWGIVALSRVALGPAASGARGTSTTVRRRR